MKNLQLLILPALLVLVFSCSNEHNPDPDPADSQYIIYFDLTGTEVKQNKYISFDLNKDGVKDFYFSTMLVGDPEAHVDKLWFFAGSTEFSSLAINSSERTARLNKGEDIPVGNFKGYIWYNVGFGLLAEKITSVSNTISWRGDWIKSTHQYLPVQILKNDQRYNGWFELSVDTQSEKLIFHKAAISSKPEKLLKAGV